MKILITGGSGFIGGHLMQELAQSHRVVGLYKTSAPKITGARMIETDIADFDSTGKLIDCEKPDAIIHTAAMSAAADCERDPAKAGLVNVEATRALCEAAEKVGAYFIHFGTDMIFDGEHAPYREADAPAPISVYGRTKADSEKFIPKTGLVLRLSLCYGKSVNASRPTFVESAIAKIAAREKVAMFDDEWRTPLWVGDIARLMPPLLDKKPAGVVHVGGPEKMSRYEMGVRICKALGLDESLIDATSRLQAQNPPRQKDLSLENARLQEIVPDFEFTNFEKSIIISFRFKK